MRNKSFFILYFAVAVLMLASCRGISNPLSGSDAPELFRIYQGGKLGYINRKGEVVIQPQFTAGGHFSEGLALACIEYQKCGFIDNTGKFVINPQFKEGNRFSEGLSAVVVENKLGFVDKTGKFAINPQFTPIGEAVFFSEGLVNVKIGDKFGYADKDGKIVINPQFDQASPFFEGLAAIRTGSKWGFIDKDGKIAINPQFDVASIFSNGLAAVKIGENFGYIDKTGKIAINPQFSGALPFNDDAIALVSLNEKVGFIDKDGKYIINPQYAMQGWNWSSFFDATSEIGLVSFSEGLAPVQVSDKKAGYIDKTGKIVINPQFTMALPFHGGLAQVYTGSEMAYIDKEGNFVWRETKETPKPPSNMTAATNSNTTVSNTAQVTNSAPAATNERNARLTTDSNIRSEANRDSASLGIHFKNAKIKILDETSYMRDGENVTWYRIRITEYGCSVDANLGCGKNSPGDADEGWINAKNVLLD